MSTGFYSEYSYKQEYETAFIDENTAGILNIFDKFLNYIMKRRNKEKPKAWFDGGTE